MRDMFPTLRYTWRPLSRTSLLALSGLLSWSTLGYSGGPVFTNGNVVAESSGSPHFILRDTGGGAADWVLKADDEPLLAQGFTISWEDAGDKANALSIENGTPENALYVDDLGQVGLGTAAPQEDLHIVGVSPGIFFEDNMSPTQSWLLMADSSGLQVRDMTNNSRTPFSIAPGASTNALRVGENSNIGIGVAFPDEAVDVARSETASRFQLTSYADDASHAPQFVQRRAGGTEDAPRAVQRGDNLGLLSFRGMRPNGLFSGSQATLTVQASENWTNEARGTRILFGTTQNGTSTVQPVMEITHDGRVLINGSQLSVPDYVFADDYELMPLDELQAYIDEHHHLPEVASEAEVKAEGVDLTGTQMALLKKVEELTVYTLQQHEQLGQQAAQLQTLQTQNMALQQELAAKDAELAWQANQLARRVAIIEHQLTRP